MDLKARLPELARLVGDPNHIDNFRCLYLAAQRELEALRAAGLDQQEARRLGAQLQDLLLAEGDVLEARRERVVAERRAAAAAAASN